MILKNCNSEEFIEKLNGRKIICFGAGSFLKNPTSMSLGEIQNLENYVDFFVDNDPQKNGLKYHYKGKIFDIYNPEIFNKIDLSNYVILITCISYVDICLQLMDIKLLDNVECYIYRMIIFFPDRDLQKFFNNNTSNLNNWKINLKNLNLKDKHKQKRCFIIGNGPSLKANDLDLLKDEITFAVNRIWYIFNETQWRPTYYMCADQIGYCKDHELVHGVDAELKFVPYGNALLSNVFYKDIIYYKCEIYTSIVKNNEIECAERFPFSFDITDKIYSGFTILYEAVQLAVYMGFSEIYLLGVDCNFKYERKEDGTIVNNDVNDYFTNEYENGFDENIVVTGVPAYQMKIAWQSAKEACEKVGVTIKNATRGGKLEVFERVDFDELMGK